MSSTTETAAQVINDFLNERTATASAEANVQAVVRVAYKATVDEAEGRMQAQQAAPGIRYAAEVATGGRITAGDFVDAVKFNMGI